MPVLTCTGTGNLTLLKRTAQSKSGGLLLQVSLKRPTLAFWVQSESEPGVKHFYPTPSKKASAPSALTARLS